MGRLAVFLAIFAAILLPVSLTAQDPGSTFPVPQSRGGRSNSRYPIAGTLRDQGTNRGIENARIDLRKITGATVATAFTNSNGDFQFSDIPVGTYALVVEAVEYESSNEQLSVDGPVFGTELWLRRLGSVKVSSNSPTVSARELSIPEKAHDAMQKALMLLYEKQDYRGSIVQFERAIKAYPDYYEAYAQMGMAYMGLRDEPNSEQALRKSIQISKDKYVDAYCMLATLLSSSGRFGDAEAAARRGTEIDANSWQANFELAYALYELQRFDNAEASAMAASQLKPDNPTLYLLLADIHGRLGKVPEALADLNAYLKLRPTGAMSDQARAIHDKIEQGLKDDPPEDPANDPADSEEPPAAPVEPPASPAPTASR